jgi:hypothetical protein
LPELPLTVATSVAAVALGSTAAVLPREVTYGRMIVALA